MSERHPVLSCHHLRKSFKDGLRTIDVLTDVNLVIQPGECVAILGASGSGKSTLLHLLGGLDQPDSGDVFVSGHQLTKISEKKLCELRNRYLGFAYQFHHLLPEFNALENVAMPLLVRGCKPAEAKQAANEILNAVGLAERTTHKIAQLSGGERQRTAIARALVTKPSCVLADEPTGNLDHNTAEKVFELMLELNQQLKTSFLIVTHDLNLAKRMHRTLTLEEGVLCE